MLRTYKVWYGKPGRPPYKAFNIDTESLADAASLFDDLKEDEDFQENFSDSGAAELIGVEFIGLPSQ